MSRPAVAAAPAFADSTSPPEAPENVTSIVWRILLPSALLPVMALFAFVSWRLGNSSGALCAVGGSAVALGLIVVWQAVALAEVNRLTAKLRQAQTQLWYRAAYDATTDLPNRNLLQERLQHELSVAQLDQGSVLVLVVDLDRFKEVNNVLGHELGDELLRDIAQRLQDQLPDGATLARVGGDEFALVLPGLDEDSANSAADHVRSALSTPFIIEGQSIAIGANIGAACFPKHAIDAVTLLQRADIAMLEAEREQLPFRCYDPSLNGAGPEQLSLVSDLRDCLAHGGLFLLYQPKVSLATGLLCGVEALVRWQHPRIGMIAPDQFIPLAEQTGLIVPLTAWVLDEAMRQCATWDLQGLEIDVSVNISARNLRDPDLVGTIEGALARHNVPASRLCLELTESMVMINIRETQAIFRRLSAMDIRLAIDDFGTGYSSLAYLSSLPVHELKIDQSFVRRMRTESQDQAIVALAIGLAHSLGLSVVIEGVEDAETWGMLALLGADVAQGYYMSRPKPPEQIIVPVLQWSEYFALGIPEIDRQLQTFVMLINRLHDALNHGNDRETIEQLLAEVREYACEHFATEQAVMEESSYPDYRAHVAAHGSFIAEVDSLSTRIDGCEPIIVLQLTSFLSDWLTSHILALDKDLSRFLRPRSSSGVA